MRVRAEITTEPFQGEGALPDHVAAAADAFREHGLAPDLGPLGTTVRGDVTTVTAAMHAAARAALTAGAARVSMQIERVDD